MEREKTTEELYIEAYRDMLDKAIDLNRKLLNELAIYRAACPKCITGPDCQDFNLKRR
ncbi:hypothetical protein LJC61_02665 [Ruminococcaceae bacterium OttesenSCG-928-A16]|nr:hypothetical protein [Ruminococcaceae bacterium OttesenSCG-928-A16]